MSLREFVNRMCNIDGAKLTYDEKADAMKILVREYLARPPSRRKGSK